MVTIKTTTTAKCLWCLETTEGVQAQFQDGLTGFFCKKHFWQALQVRADQSESQNSQLTSHSKKPPVG